MDMNQIREINNSNNQMTNEVHEVSITKSSPFSGYMNQQFIIDDYLQNQEDENGNNYDDYEQKSITTNYITESNFRPYSVKNSQMIDKEFENIQRDTTNLNTDSKLRHLKTVGAFIGSAFGFF